ncbi:MAG: hypothetical protein Q9165_005813 [Trypethelium subeluteriae]
MLAAASELENRGGSAGRGRGECEKNNGEGGSWSRPGRPEKLKRLSVWRGRGPAADVGDGKEPG